MIIDHTGPLASCCLLTFFPCVIVALFPIGKNSAEWSCINIRRLNRSTTKNDNQQKQGFLHFVLLRIFYSPDYYVFAISYLKQSISQIFKIKKGLGNQACICAYFVPIAAEIPFTPLDSCRVNKTGLTLIYRGYLSIIGLSAALTYFRFLALQIRWFLALVRNGAFDSHALPPITRKALGELPPRAFLRQLFVCREASQDILGLQSRLPQDRLEQAGADDFPGVDRDRKLAGSFRMDEMLVAPL